MTQTPLILCFGAQKAGTTCLHHLLSSNNSLFLPSIKETHFFSKNFHLGLNWYSSLFDFSDNSICSGEITPYYSFHPLALHRIKCLFPTTKIIMLVRDPISRAISQFYHSRRLGFEPLDFQSAIMHETDRLRFSLQSILLSGFHTPHQENSYISRSLYDIQIKTILSLFPRNNVHIIKCEALFNTPQQIGRELGDFLNTDLLFPSIIPKVYEGTYTEIDHLLDDETTHHLNIIFSPTYAFMSEEFGITWH